MTECPCDFGMPSGHTGNSLTSYYLINRYFSSLITHSKLAPITKQYLRLIVFVACLSIFFCIALSRIVLGVHSWNQVLMGLLTTLPIICFFNDDSFLDLLRMGYRNKYLLYIPVVGIPVLSILNVSLFELRLHSEPDPEQVHWDQCPSCNGNFFQKSFSDSTASTIFFCFLVSAFLN